MREGEAAAYAAMALGCVHRPYPNQVQHSLDDDGDVRSPRALHPVFWGCYDWHSAVHGHWTIAAYARRFGATLLAAEARAALARSFAPEACAMEMAYLVRRPGFERPYGLAWLCELHRELRRWADDGGGAAGVAREPATWAALLEPPAALGARRMTAWLEQLGAPVRSGTHAQSAFAAGLVLDWARTAGETALAARIEAASRRLHGSDRGPALHLEPSGEDFLSPALGAADLMRRVLAPDELAAWLDRALPELRDAGDLGDVLVPAVPADRDDGRLVHLDGLNASRAWMLDAIARALPADDSRRAALHGSAATHAAAALEALGSQSYAGTHWLGTFALYMQISRST